MKKLYFAVTVTGIILLLWLYYTYNPAKHSFFLQCPFHYLTGWDCPGCGSQRAIHCLLHGDIRGAIHQNLLLVLSLPLLAVQVAYKVKSYITKKDHKWAFLYYPLTPVIIGIITIAFFVIRNLPVYPFKH